MALNFPNSPTNGQIYTDTLSGNSWTWDSANTCWKSTSTYIQTITVSSSAPGTPAVGQLWWNRDYGRLLVYYSDGDTSQWVDASPSDYTSQLAYNQANAVSIVANTALPNTSGVSFNGSLNVPSGNLGIGTNSPSSNFRITADNSLTNNGVRINLADYNKQALYIPKGYIAGDSTSAIGKFTIGNFGDSSSEMCVATRGVTTFYTGAIDNSGGTERVRIDSSGRVIKPYQPAFLARMNGTGGNTYTGNIVYPSTEYNIGSHYSTSTGIFTAPVAGIYMFYVHMIPRSSSSGSPTRLYFTKNGTIYITAGTGTSQIRAVYTDITYDWTMLIQCSANDAIRVFIGNQYIDDDMSYQHFGGYLLG